MRQSLAIGVDLVEVARIAEVLARHPERFLSRHFTVAERRQCGTDAVRLAARWAAKEAAVKALGTGIGPVGWRDVEILCDPSGRPALGLHGPASRIAADAGVQVWSVSMSHTELHAVAVVAGVGVANE